MTSHTGPGVKELVLVGGGHSHVTVLKRFGMRPLPRVGLTLISRDVHTPYSGMLPGFVSGHYTYDDAHIDLGPLARFAGARFSHDEVIGLDVANRRVQCRQGPDVPYDVLSINIGSTPGLTHVPGAEKFVVPVKPISTFVARWQQLVTRVLEGAGPVRIGVIGAGAAGVELCLALQYRLTQLLREAGNTAVALTLHVFSATATILPTHTPRVQSTFLGILAQRGVQVHCHCRIAAVHEHEVHCTDGARYELDEIVWVIDAIAPPWLAEAGLAVDAKGFIRVQDTLESISHPAIFAAGDIAAVDKHPREKAGVIAVRQGPPLARNLRRAVSGQPLRPFIPQKKWLSLISTGDKYAVASWGGLTLSGRVVWAWKDWIDRRFIRKFTV